MDAVLFATGRVLSARHLSPAFGRKKEGISMNDVKWTKKEKLIARQAFDKAYERECKAIGVEIRKRIENFKEPRDIWRIHDFLDEQRKETDFKYDYRYSVLLRLFGRLIAEGWLEIGDLEGLNEEKISKIESLAQYILQVNK